MSHRILVAYATQAGSTSQVASATGKEIAKGNAEVDILPLDQVKALDGYDGVVLGAPMIMGWHRGALRFLKRHRNECKKIPLAVFVMAMSLTKTGEMTVDGVPTLVNNQLATPLTREGRLSFREKYATVSNHARPIVAAIRPAKPVSIAFFGGRMEYGRLPWWAVLFALVIIQAPAGDKRNWNLIRSWGAGLPTAFGLKAS